MRGIILNGMFMGMGVYCVISCVKDVNIEPGSCILEAYYPIQTGDIRTYTIDSITYDYDGDLQQIVIDTLRYYLQEHVLETVTINGEEWYRIGQYRGVDAEGNFELSNYVYERKSAQRLLRMEGNLTFIPLASPLTLFDEWDGTAYFDGSTTTRFVRGEKITPYENWNYLYLKKWETHQVHGKAWSDVIQINQRDTSSIQVDNEGGVIPPEEQLFYYLANEFFAPETGLISKEEYYLSSICASSGAEDFQAFCDTTTIFQNAERGYIFHKRLVSFE